MRINGEGRGRGGYIDSAVNTAAITRYDSRVRVDDAQEGLDVEV